MRWRGAISIVWLLLSWAALDDITTDNANSFPLEYSILIAAGMWFAALGVWLLLNRRTLSGVCSIVALALGMVAFTSLPHHYQPATFTNLLGYVPVAWFLGITVWLLAAAERRPAPSP